MTKVGIDLLAIFLWNIHICHGGAQKMSVFGSIYVGGLLPDLCCVTTINLLPDLYCVTTIILLNDLYCVTTIKPI